MKLIDSMDLEQLNAELHDRLEAAFYEEIFCPKTPEEKAHNQKIEDGINEVRERIDKFPK